MKKSKRSKTYNPIIESLSPQKKIHILRRCIDPHDATKAENAAN